MIQGKDVLDTKPKAGKIVGREAVMPVATQTYNDTNVTYADVNYYYVSQNPQYEGFDMPDGDAINI